MKKIIQFFIYLLPWFLSGLFFSSYTNFFDTLNLPWFALPKSLYGIFWSILYLTIAISIYMIYSKNSCKHIKGYNQSLLSNYLFNQFYLFFMFFLQNPFLGFVDSLAILITSLLLYYETKEINTSAAKWLLPYVYFNLYATILSLSIYFMNFQLM